MKHKCLSSLIVFILFITISGVIGFGVSRGVTTANFINSTLVRANFYHNLRDFANSLADTAFAENFQGQILVKLFGELIEPADLQSQVEKNSIVFVGYLRSEKATLDVSFDLRKIKSAVKVKSGLTLPSIVAEEVKNLPTCEENQQPGKQISCIPIDKSQADFANQLIANYDPEDILKMLPDDFVLASVVKNPEQTFAGGRLFFSTIKIGFYVCLILSLILIFFLVLLGRTDPASVLRWTGAALMIPGGLSLLGVFLSKPLSHIVSQQIYENLSSEFIKFASPLIDTLNQSAIQIALLYSGAVFFLGLILIIVSFIVPHKAIPPAPPIPQSPPAPSGGLRGQKA